MTRKPEHASLAEWTRHIQSSSPRPELAAANAIQRRAVFGVLAGIGGALAFASLRSARADCVSPAKVPIQGPYYLGDPEEKYDTGGDIVLHGTVVDAKTCAPIAGASIVRWHANDAGFYEEFYRAQMLTKADGTFSMSTIAPGQYAGLARHVHWYVTADGYQPLTDQIQWSDGVVISGTQAFNFSLTKL
jgi:protocatechuate 3,4-dioxygenase beta subunit